MSKTLVTISKNELVYFEGLVLSMVNWGNEDRPDWYVEFLDIDHGYIYIKQIHDGLSDYQFTFKVKEE